MQLIEKFSGKWNTYLRIFFIVISCPLADGAVDVAEPTFFAQAPRHGQADEEFVINMKKNAGREGTLVFVTIFIATSGESVLQARLD